MSSSRTMMFPFTAAQWQELEHQALVYKYMLSGVPIPPDLLFTIRRSLDSSISSKFLMQQPQQIDLGSWPGFQMGFGRKIDPEPGRCRRTDGKKWRCSKEAYPDSKYCERHMHRGRNRSRKPVEMMMPTTNANITNHSNSYNNSPVNTKDSSSPNPKSHSLFSLSSTSAGSSESNVTNLYAYGTQGSDNYRNRNENLSKWESIGSVSALQLAPLAMSSASSVGQLKRGDARHHYYKYDDNVIPPLSIERDEDHHQSKKVMHHFLDEWPQKEKDDSWINSEKKVPNSLHDFFMTHK